MLPTSLIAISTAISIILFDWKVEFTSISGSKVEVTISPSTQPSQQIRLRGLGMPISNTEQYGDQILLLKPYIPDNISNDIIDSINRFKLNT